MLRLGEHACHPLHQKETWHLSKYEELAVGVSELVCGHEKKRSRCSPPRADWDFLLFPPLRPCPRSAIGVLWPRPWRWSGAPLLASLLGARETPKDCDRGSWCGGQLQLLRIGERRQY
jgi:hypothetical protein